MKASSGIEKCVTCDYWAGNREIVQNGYYVEADANERGSCNAPGSTSRLLENKQAQWTCPNWEKWGAIR